MTDLDQLREVGRQVIPPPFEDLVATARSRARRTRIITAAAALTVVAAMGLGYAVASADGDSSSGPAKAPSPGLPSPTADSSLPDGVRGLPEVGPNEEPPPLAAGRYRVPLSDTLAVDVDLPQGTTANSDGLYLETKQGILKVETAGDGYGVPNDPCHLQYIAPVGPTVENLVRAIRRQPIYEVSRPEPVDIDGAQGIYLQIRIPSSYDSSSCESGEVGLPGNPDTRNNMRPGYIGDWWILDVDGQRVVAQQICDGCRPGDMRGLEGSVRSITFTTGR